MSKYTAGPWTLETVPTQVGHCHKIGPFPSNGGSKKETYACVYVDGLGLRPEDAPELLANARLIVAAPGLLEACKVALLSLRAWNQVGLGDAASAAARQAYEHSPEIQGLIKAIEKAEGTK